MDEQNLLGALVCILMKKCNLKEMIVMPEELYEVEGTGLKVATHKDKKNMYKITMIDSKENLSEEVTEILVDKLQELKQLLEIAQKLGKQDEPRSKTENVKKN